MPPVQSRPDRPIVPRGLQLYAAVNLPLPQQPQSKEAAQEQRVKPISKRQKREQGKRIRAADKRASKFVPAECVWETSKQGGFLHSNKAETCCSNCCSAKYTPEGHDDSARVVQSLRAHYIDALGCEGRREFICRRVQFSGHDHPPGIDLKGKVLYKHYLEDPSCMWDRLSAIDSGMAHCMPDPAFHDVQPVCIRFFLFATGGHRDTLYQNNTRKDAEFADADVCDISNRQAPRKKRKAAPDVDKHSRVVRFLRNAAAMGLNMPNADLRILPWNSIMSTHAAYAREEEVRLLVPWDIQDFSKQPGALPPRAEARYGNRLMGKLSEQRVHKDIASLSYFRKVWHEDHFDGKYTIRRWIPFAKCDVCKAFKNAERFYKDSNVRKEKQKQYDSHLRDVKLERRCYYSNRLRAESNPAKYLSLIIDGADQSDQYAPHYAERSHASAGAVKQKLFAYGCISHGRKGYAYTVLSHVKQGHDTTIEVLWRVLHETLEREGRIPPVLLLQLDNTTKQNKGKYLFAFLGLLVHYGVVRKIIASFLPVGHTVHITAHHHTCPCVTYYFLSTKTSIKCSAALPCTCASTTPYAALH